MLNRKLLCIFVMILSAILVCGCASESGNTENQQSQETVTDSINKDNISIPTDSGLGDSVFEDESRAPTKTDNEISALIPDETTQQLADSTDPSVEATAPATSPEDMTYEAFTALSPEEQRLYQESFNDLDAFFEWYNAAKEKYEKENPPIDIDGPVDLGKY